jgi:hypothetical protein
MESSEDRSLRWGQERDRTFLSVKRAPFEEKVSAYEALGRRLVKEARGPRERIEIQRRIAEDLLRVSRSASWRVFSQYLRRLERLGFTSLDRRLLACVLAAEAARGSLAGSRKVKALIENTERHARRSRDPSVTATEVQHALARARQIAGLSEEPERSPRSPRSPPRRPRQSRNSRRK